jgi:hypothetical protein
VKVGDRIYGGVSSGCHVTFDNPLDAVEIETDGVVYRITPAGGGSVDVTVTGRALPLLAITPQAGNAIHLAPRSL